MKRVGCLLFAALPVVVTAGVYVLTPAHSQDGTSTTSASAASNAAADAKHRAEQEKSEDDTVIADLPAGLAAPAKKELAQGWWPAPRTRP